MINERQSNIEDDYEILNSIGEGSYAQVKKAINRHTGHERAIKIISKEYQTKQEQDTLINEVNCLKQLDHPYIIKIYDFYQDKKSFYIVTDLCKGGELFDYIIEQGSITESMAAQIFSKLISALMYCHQHNIVHRDLKPENLLLDIQPKEGQEPQLKIIDFGTSTHIDKRKKLKGKFGTVYYIAPEVLKHEYNEKCDIWSAGVILYIMLCGQPPFNGENDERIIEAIKLGYYKFEQPEWTNVSQDAILLIRQMLDKDVKKRFSAEQVMAHPWIQNNLQKKQQDGKQISGALQNMKKFNIQKKVQEATYVFLVNYITSKEDKQKLLDIFKQIDKNGDGQLSRQELLDGYKNILKVDNPEQMVDQILSEVDNNNNGFIDYHEFVMAAANKQKIISKESLQSAFKLIDKDGSGTITISELQQQFGSSIPESMWEEMIQEADQNNDGEIQYMEFQDIMFKLLDNQDN